MEATTVFAQRLRSLREEKGFSVRGLAALVGVSSVTIWKWESGAAKPRDTARAALARALYVDPSSLDPTIPYSLDLDHGVPSAVQFRLPVPSNDTLPAEAKSSEAREVDRLSEVISRAKEMVAKACGVAVSQVSVRIRY